jgi:hypothetical protein
MILLEVERVRSSGYIYGGETLLNTVIVTYSIIWNNLLPRTLTQEVFIEDKFIVKCFEKQMRATCHLPSLLFTYSSALKV